MTPKARATIVRAAAKPAIVRAARRERVDRTPVWFMRQAGRALPEYRAIRDRHGLIEICQAPELCAEVTLQPVRRLGVDAAVLFADIMLPIAFGLGVTLELVESVGPIIEHPVRSRADVDAFHSVPAADAVPFVMETTRMVRRELPTDVAVIGFSGAPFTLASYLVEGRPSRDFLLTKMMISKEPALWDALMSRLTRLVLDYLLAQVHAGADMVQVFDSWVGALAPADYRACVLPYARPIFDALAAAKVPVVHFGTSTAGILALMREAGGDVIGLDWRVDLGAAWDLIGDDRGVQGNLDPATLLGPWPVIERATTGILKGARGRPGHIFNLGHGVLPDTPVESLQRLVEYVHTKTAQAV